MEAFHLWKTFIRLVVVLGTFISMFWVRWGLEMILSHMGAGTPSSFNMSPHRAIWTHFNDFKKGVNDF